MSQKTPHNFMAPDDPTAVYPIGSLRMDEEDDGTPSPITDPERIALPAHDPEVGPNPLVAAAAVGVGMLLMGVLVAGIGLLMMFL